ncbi:MAG: hypothetical protein H8E38_04335 [SAR324 cluster bacterium]|nr:hypothetical protein [SAR324 cluster bacterium]
MIRHLLVIVLTVFQDNYVRIGTFSGLLAGFWSTEFISGEPVSNALTFGFIGWGLGAYLAGYLADSSQYSKKKKFRVFQGGR